MTPNSVKNSLEGKLITDTPDSVVNLILSGQYSQAINKLNNAVIPVIQDRIKDPDQTTLIQMINDLMPCLSSL